MYALTFMVLMPFYAILVWAQEVQMWYRDFRKGDKILGTKMF